MNRIVWNSQSDGPAPQQPAYGGAPRQDQPQYGQYKEPEYGEMASRYPGWNPYVYGAPEPEPSDKGDADDERRNPKVPGGPGNAGDNYRNGIDLDDPAQNPLYGRWDPAAIIAFISALIGVPVLPVLLGAFAIYRSGLFRMKGRALAVAAVIIGLLTTAFDIYVMATGVDPYQLIYQLYGIDMGGSSGSGETSV
ncbi:hypothetical protein CS006_08980 [Bifidobacterium primatium]|uniref:DUF4190 domain-containing protein n=1 Tax=Bifidobacterium primatium TaxID=2045438 RepID=A0A2M9H7A8_9BIFI|nr:hypothetical protein [Bifidobacterium primatium]PJM72685.1 hypothetical protein CS006_08980 [Bifidobacterium primatium]